MIRGVRWQRGPDRWWCRAGQGAGERPASLRVPGLDRCLRRIVSASGAHAALAELVPQVTAGAPWIERPPSTLNISFTYRGLAALGLPEALLASFPDHVQAGDGGAGRDAG